jgi:hypothetical protein
MEQNRRGRGTAVGLPVVYAPVPEEAKNVVVATAKALKISQAQAVEVILLSLPLGADGVPESVDRHAFARNQELPIPAA